MYLDEFMIDDVVSEYYTDFALESQKISNLREKVRGRFIVESNDELVNLINNKMEEKLDKISSDYKKIEKWWNSYMEAVNDLKNGFYGTVHTTDYFNYDFEEAKKILNDNIE